MIIRKLQQVFKIKNKCKKVKDLKIIFTILMRNKKKIFLNKILMNRYTMRMKLKNNKLVKILIKKIKKRKLIKKI